MWRTSLFHSAMMNTSPEITATSIGRAMFMKRGMPENRHPAVGSAKGWPALSASLMTFHLAAYSAL